MEGDSRATADANGGNRLTVTCGNCKKDFTETDPSHLVSASSADSIKPKCPTCKMEGDVVSREIGCPSCRRNFWAFTGLDGHEVRCPQCETEITLPTEDQWTKLAEEGSQFKWTVVPADSSEAENAGGFEDLADRMTSGALRPGDLCASHSFAPWRKLREACDEHYTLRKLYDPLGAYTDRGGNVVGVTLCVLYLIGHVIGGLMTMGGTYLLAAIFGVLAVVLTPTIIGLGIVYVIARAFGIPLLGAYIGVLLIGLSAGLAFLIGMGIGRGVTWVFAKATGVEARRSVNWD